MIHDLTCAIPAGAVVGLVGPNGAGKTTLMRTLATLLRPHAGTVRVFGLDVADRADVRAIRANLGFLPQDFTADESFTVHEYVAYCLWLRGCGKARLDDLAARSVDRAGLTDQAGRKLSTLSGGMRQRAGIAAALAAAGLRAREAILLCALSAWQLVQLTLLALVHNAVLDAGISRQALGALATSTVFFQGLGMVSASLFHPGKMWILPLSTTMAFVMFAYGDRAAVRPWNMILSCGPANAAAAAFALGIAAGFAIRPGAWER